MHRHGYKGRKLGRDKDQRRALQKGLASNLIEHGKIVTTLPKAKETLPYVEKLITKAKKGDLHSRRQIMAKVAHPSSAHKLVDEIAPLLKGRDSGHLRIVRTTLRRGDNAQMAEISFVDDIKQAPVAKAAENKKPTNAKAKKTTTKKVTAAKAKTPKAAASSAASKVGKSSAKTAAKKTERKV